MKAIFIFFLFVLSLRISAQPPQLVNYQSVARDVSGIILANQNIAVRFSIHDVSAGGPVLYSERQTLTTNQFGLFTCSIGGGTVLSGTFSTIDWGAGNKYLQVEFDPAGGTNYTDMGASQLLSVPYALYARNSSNAATADSAANCNFIKGGNGRVVVYTLSNAYGFGINSIGNSVWVPTSISGTLLGAVASDSGIAVYTTSNVYGFAVNSIGNSTWTSMAVSGTVLNAVACSGRIVVYTTSNAYGFGVNSVGNFGWSSTTITGTVLGAVAGGDRIALYTTSNAYGFGLNSTGNNTWLSISITGTPVGIMGTK
jgi:trimeric autotransporter adhesin